MSRRVDMCCGRRRVSNISLGACGRRTPRARGHSGTHLETRVAEASPTAPSDPIWPSAFAAGMRRKKGCPKIDPRRWPKVGNWGARPLPTAPRACESTSASRWRGGYESRYAADAPADIQPMHSRCRAGTGPPCGRYTAGVEPKHRAGTGPIFHEVGYQGARRFHLRREIVQLERVVLARPLQEPRHGRITAGTQPVQRRRTAGIGPVRTDTAITIVDISASPTACPLRGYRRSL